MEDVKLNLEAAGRGSFLITEGGETLGEMAVSVSGNTLTAYHTEVSPRAEGKGLAKKLLASMVDYARNNQLKVIALCPFVHAQFSRHPEQYSDIWQKRPE
jgi:predicted GNAT family acetyltransferase